MSKGKVIKNLVYVITNAIWT